MYRHISETTCDITTPTQQNPFNYMYSTLYGSTYRKLGMRCVQMWTCMDTYGEWLLFLCFGRDLGTRLICIHRYVVHGVGGTALDT